MFEKIDRVADILRTQFGNQLVITWDGARFFFVSPTRSAVLSVADVRNHNAQEIAQLIANRFV